MSSQDTSQTVDGPASNGDTNGKTLGQRMPRMHRFLFPVPMLGPPINPALLKREQERAEARQNRIADKIGARADAVCQTLRKPVIGSPRGRWKEWVWLTSETRRTSA
jgi:hypothetical protein